MKRIKLSVFKWFVITCLCIYFGFMMGQFKENVLEHEVKLSKLEIDSLTNENTGLIEDISLIQADISAVKQVNEVLKSENKKLNDALQASHNKLFFYEQVVAPELAKTGLNIYSFKVEKAATAGEWSYELVLIQAQQGRSELVGDVDITFNNSNRPKSPAIKLSKIVPNFDASFKFEYFQTLKGTFSLPKRSKVDQVFVVANAKRNRTARAQRVEKIYDWKGFIENGATMIEEVETQSE